MLTGWQRDLRADPIPWLLERENPSARYLTLRHLLDSGEQDSQVTEARAEILTWPPVREILAVMDPVDFWGRADRPLYGGAMGTHAILDLLAELGSPRIPQIEAACENLLEHGQHESGGFSYDGTPGRCLLCHTGIAIRTLVHFGYAGDPQMARAFEYLVARSTAPDGLTCAYAEGEACQWGIAKALSAFAALPPTSHPEGFTRAVEVLADAVLDHEFDLDGRDAQWLDFGFPLHYQSDLVELVDVLARLDYDFDPRFKRLLDIVTEAQTAEGRWTKRYGTRALQVEERGQPSRWITIRALRPIKHGWQAVLRTDLTEMRNRVSWFDGIG